MATNSPPVLSRLACLTLGLYLTGGGIATLGTGRASHTNYLHLPASASAAVAIGLALVFAGTFGWKRLSRYF